MLLHFRLAGGGAIRQAQSFAEHDLVFGWSDSPLPHQFTAHAGNIEAQFLPRQGEPGGGADLVMGLGESPVGLLR